MDFFNPVVNFKGSVECETAPTANNHMVRKQDVSSLSFINGIASGSSSMLSVSGGELSINSLAITDVHVDNSQSSLANFVSNESSTAADIVYVGFDNDSADEDSGIPVVGATTFQTNFPIHFTKKITLIAAQNTPTVSGVIWGVSSF